LAALNDEAFFCFVSLVSSNSGSCNCPTTADCIVLTAIVNLCCTEESSEPDQEAVATVQKQRLRVGVAATSFAQMTAVFNEGPSGAQPKSLRMRSSSPTFETPDVATVVASGSSEPSGELCDAFAALNVAALHQLGGGDALLEVCDTALVYLKRYRTYYEEEIAGSSRHEAVMPTSLSEALTVRLR
jgi:hypothetical protein